MGGRAGGRTGGQDGQFDNIDEKTIESSRVGCSAEHANITELPTPPHVPSTPPVEYGEVGDGEALILDPRPEVIDRNQKTHAPIMKETQARKLELMRERFKKKQAEAKERERKRKKAERKERKKERKAEKTRKQIEKDLVYAENEMNKLNVAETAEAGGKEEVGGSTNEN